MEFHENKAKAPFIGFVQLWQAVRTWWLKKQTRRVLQQMSDELHRLQYLIRLLHGTDADAVLLT